MKTQTNMLWGAAFSQKPTEAVIAFTAGRDVIGLPPADMALLPYDLWVNQAHCVMLAKTGIIPASDAGKMLNSLAALKKLVLAGKFALNPSKEDVHTNIESWLTAELGIEIAGKLHTARSRNDQVVTDMRLYMRDQAVSFVQRGTGLATVLLELADKTKGLPMPGFTHHQHAMVTTFGHTLAGFAGMVIRDMERFEQWMALHNTSPLGGAASYGTTFPVDRKMTAALLGFDGPDHNSLDSITNRWEPETDLAFAVVMLMNHISLIAETLILLSTPEFGMVTLADGFSTGSSIMPQKKNPAPLEVMKAKAAYAHGALVSLLSMGKNNFIGYNNDSQWTKYIVMDLMYECLPVPVVLSGALKTIAIHTDVMEAWSGKGFIGATTLMEQLTSVFHLPMRTAKVIVETAVKKSAPSDSVTFGALRKALADEGMSLPITDAQVGSWQDPNQVIDRTKSYGSPGKNSMKASLKKLKKKVSGHQSWLHARNTHLEEAVKLLEQAIASVLKGGEIV